MGNLAFAAPTKGAYSSVFAAAAPIVKAKAAEYGGAYMNGDTTLGKKGVPSEDCWNDELAAELWATTKTLLEELGVWDFDANISSA